MTTDRESRESKEAFCRARPWLEEQFANAKETLSLKGFPESVSVYRLRAPVRTDQEKQSGFEKAPRSRGTTIR